jgi:ParB family chromosome partitioning protein
MNEQKIVELNIEELQQNPLQPRGLISPESLVDLVDSIREHGILEPLVVAKTPAGYLIIAGERRWRAAKIVGLKTVPSIVKETSPQGMLEMAIVENVQRTDLNPLERARAFQRLIDEFALGTAEISKRIGKSQAYVSNSLRLLTLPDALKDGLLSSLISEGHARALAAIDDKRLMVDAYKIILRESGSVRRAEDLARRMKHESGQGPRPKARKEEMKIVSKKIDEIREKMEKALGEPGESQVKLTRSLKQTRLQIVLKGNPKKTEEKLQKIFKGIIGK